MLVGGIDGGSLDRWTHQNSEKNMDQKQGSSLEFSLESDQSESNTDSFNEPH